MGPRFPLLKKKYALVDIFRVETARIEIFLYNIHTIKTEFYFSLSYAYADERRRFRNILSQDFVQISKVPEFFQCISSKAKRMWTINPKMVNFIPVNFRYFGIL